MGLDDHDPGSEPLSPAPATAATASRRQFKTPQQWLNFIKTNGCGNCHQYGNYATRNIPAALGHFDSSQDAWSQRLSVGPAGHDMVRFITELMTPDGGHSKALADWTDRIKAGELPSRSPPRPVGVERNLVVTVRDWLDPKHYLHDLTVTDRRNPTVNGYGLIYGATELSTSDQPVLDPVHNTKTTIRPPVRDGTPSSALANEVVVPSPYWGMEQTWDSQVNAHNPMMDQDGRVWFTAQNRPPNDIPAYCKQGSSLRSAQIYPLDVTHEGFFQNSRQVTVYDPKSKKFTTIDTCFGTHHLNFAEDADNTLWLSNNTQGKLAVVGWINTKKFWETGDAAASQGWTPLIVDTVGDGKRTPEWNEPGQPVDPKKDTRIPFGDVRDRLLAGRRFDLGLEPDASRLHHPPGAGLRILPIPRSPNSTRCRCPGSAFAAWTSIATASPGCRSTAAISRASTDASARGRLTGRVRKRARMCPEGFSFYPLPGPGFQGDPGAEENPYYVWVDQHDILGLGGNVPIATGNQSDSLHALVGRPDRRAPRAVSDGVLREGHRRADRRSERRLERPWPMGHLRKPDAVSYRRN